MYTVKELNERLIDSYKRIFNLDNFYAKLLVAKGFSGEDIIQLLIPEKAIMDPRLLVNGEKAVERIKQFIQKCPKGTFWIYGDYDADGMTSSSIMKYALEKLIKSLNAECKIEVVLPNRTDGYGINSEWASETFLNEECMVITVDNGTNAREAISVLNERQIPVVVTDHHQPESEIAECLIVNPSLYEKDPHKHLAGCGVAFKLGMLMNGFEVMKEVIDLLAIGTIGDMMDMTNENIAFCQLGLERINQNKCHEGIRLLKSSDTLTYKDIAFEIVPKLNACGRMNRMALGKDFMFSPDSENVIALEALNEERKAITKTYFKNAQKQNSCVVVLEDCFIGMAGIIAGQLCESLKANVVVFTGNSDELKGSARAYGNASILKQINSFKDTYESLFASGHDEACGIKINRNELTAFAKDFDALQKTLLSTDKEDQEEPSISVDMELALEDVNNQTLHFIRQIPYDKKERQEPLFMIKANLDKKEVTKSNPNNIWLYLSKDNKKLNKIWGQNLTEKVQSLRFKKDLKFIATIEKDFMNPKYTTLKIIDIVE